MYKKCKTCTLEKRVEDFNSNGLLKSGTKKLRSHCKVCEYENRNNYYKNIVLEYFGSLSCQNCGYDKHFSVLDLHHLDPSQKDFDLSKKRDHSKEKLIKELKKCKLLCANCHREEHLKMRAEQRAAGIPCKDSV